MNLHNELTRISNEVVQKKLTQERVRDEKYYVRNEKRILNAIRKAAERGEKSWTIGEFYGVLSYIKCYTEIRRLNKFIAETNGLKYHDEHVTWD